MGSGNLALHIKFQGSVATFNSFSDGKWGVAFNAKIHENVTNGLKFDVRIRAFDDKFEVRDDLCDAWDHLS